MGGRWYGLLGREGWGEGRAIGREGDKGRPRSETSSRAEIVCSTVGAAGGVTAGAEAQV